MVKLQAHKRFIKKRASNCRVHDGVIGSVYGRVRTAFTLAEVMMVIVILGIAALAVIPLMSQGTQTQAYAATEMVVADIEYARNLAMTRGGSYSVQFDAANESYQIEDPNGDVVAHPVNKGFDYVVDFANHRELGQVDIVSVNFDTTSVIKFDYLGAPWNGLDPPTPLTNGAVVIRAGAVQQTVLVEPVTGVISVSN